MGIPVEIQQARREATEQERRRIVGMVLAEFAVRKMAGDEHTARVLDTLATDIEKSYGVNNQPTGERGSSADGPSGS